MVTSVLVYDAIHANIGQLPKGVQVAGRALCPGGTNLG